MMSNLFFPAPPIVTQSEFFVDDRRVEIKHGDGDMKTFHKSYLSPKFMEYAKRVKFRDRLLMFDSTQAASASGDIYHHSCLGYRRRSCCFNFG